VIVELKVQQVIVVVMVNQVPLVPWDLKVMLAIQVNQAHQVVQVQWVTLVHQVLHFPVKKVKRVFQAQLVFPVHKVPPVSKVNQVEQHL